MCKEIIAETDRIFQLLSIRPSNETEKQIENGKKIYQYLVENTVYEDNVLNEKKKSKFNQDRILKGNILSETININEFVKEGGICFTALCIEDLHRALIEKRGVCTSEVFALKYLFHRAKIPCEPIFFVEEHVALGHRLDGNHCVIDITNTRDIIRDEAVGEDRQKRIHNLFFLRLDDYLKATDLTVCRTSEDVERRLDNRFKINTIIDGYRKDSALVNK